MCSAAVETMAYARSGGVPWHGLGFAVNDDLTPEEMQIAAGLDWKVETVPIYLGNGKQIADNYAIVRSTDNRVLSLCGKRFVPTQNENVFEFFKEYVSAAQASMETAGSLHDGREIWALAKLNEGFSVWGDRVEGYLFLANSHKPGTTLRVGICLTRIVCMNTLMMGEDEAKGNGNYYRFYHSRQFTPKIQERVKEEMGIARHQIEHFKHQAEVLARFQMNEKLAVNTVINVFGKPDEKEVDQPRVVGKIMDLFEGQAIGADMRSANGTAWGLLNATTEYLDHHAGRGVDTRLHSAWMGNGAQKKLKMFNQLIKLAA